MQTPGTSSSRSIAYFVSPHAFGHAARASAVMAAAQELEPALRFEVFTRVPRWFFEESLTGSFGYHSLLTDIGLVQKTSLREDVPATVRRLDEFLPFEGAQIQRLASRIAQLECRLVMCDIAPMGIAVAHAAGVPAALVENFTWDWVYTGYLDEDAGLERYIRYLHRWFDAASYHIQTEPICQRRSVDLTTAPISRQPRSSRMQIRQRLAIPSRAHVVLITMGGIEWRFDALDPLMNQPNVHFIIPGGAEQMQTRDGLILLPHYHDLYHPDLVNAADAVVGKVGYSTLAEVYYAGVPFGYIRRPQFRESSVLGTYIEEEMQGLAISETEFQSGRWVSRLPNLLALPRVGRRGTNGAGQVAHFVLELLG
ncbi:MAG: hypothetical protein MAG451_00558 [Anaerolineales bacterium]|nr:hypothetical protein [Anaerolineales bacterium]